jgi:hypothetical protein
MFPFINTLGVNAALRKPGLDAVAQHLMESLRPRPRSISPYR